MIFHCSCWEKADLHAQIWFAISWLKKDPVNKEKTKYILKCNSSSLKATGTQACPQLPPGTSLRWVYHQTLCPLPSGWTWKVQLTNFCSRTLFPFVGSGALQSLLNLVQIWPAPSMVDGELEDVMKALWTPTGLPYNTGQVATFHLLTPII